MPTRLPAPLARSKGAEDIYQRLLQSIARQGEYRIEEKKSSVHVLTGRAAFVGIHPRREGFRLNVVLSRPLEDARVVKVEQVSRARYHNEIEVRSAAEVDGALTEWIAEAYELQSL